MSILFGMSLAAIIAILRLIENTTWRDFAIAVLVVAGVSAVLWYFQAQLTTMVFGSLFIFFVVLVGACVAIGVPIGFAFGIATMSYLTLTTDMPLSVVVNRMDDGMSNLLLLSVPMFVFLGLLMEMTGIARVMVAFLVALVGHVRGGLSYVLLGAMYLVSGISGSKAADMAAVAPVLFPEMRRRGQHPGELASLLATSSAMSETIPPSLVLITIGSVTNVSISALFTGGLLPALVAAIALVVVAWWRSRKEDTGGTQAGARQGDRADIADRAARLDATLRHPLCRRARGGDRDRGLDRRGGLHRSAGPADLSPVRLAADLSAAGGDRGADRRGYAHRRHRDGDGLGADAIGVLQLAGRGDGERAGRPGGLPGHHHRDLHLPGQRAGRDPGDPAVRPVAAAGRPGDGRARGALFDHRDPGDGDWAFRATLWASDFMAPARSARSPRTMRCGESGHIFSPWSWRW